MRVLCGGNLVELYLSQGGFVFCLDNECMFYHLDLFFFQEIPQGSVGIAGTFFPNVCNLISCEISLWARWGR